MDKLLATGRKRRDERERVVKKPDSNEKVPATSTTSDGLADLVASIKRKSNAASRAGKERPAKMPKLVP
jgi:hypothetical protein